MDELTIGQFKSRFSEVLSQVLKGKSVRITYGKGRKKVAALVPYKEYKEQKKITLGLLERKASFKEGEDFKITDEEFLQS